MASLDKPALAKSALLCSLWGDQMEACRDVGLVLSSSLSQTLGASRICLHMHTLTQTSTCTCAVSDKFRDSSPSIREGRKTVLTPLRMGPRAPEHRRGSTYLG